jgi:hypothetical protein
VSIHTAHPETAPAGQASRTCDWCGVTKPLSDFYPDSKGKFRVECKRCTLKRMKARTEVGMEVLQREQAKKNADWVRRYVAERTGVPLPNPVPESEVWRPVVGYETLYEVSNLGQVRSLWFTNCKVCKPRRNPLILTPFINQKTKYHSVTLVRDGVHTTLCLHKLVLDAFVGPRPEGHVGGHRDGNGSNNRLTNLDWITYEENEADKRRHGRMMTGERNHQAKLTDEKVRRMRFLYARDKTSTYILGPMFGVSPSVAWKIVTGQAWQHVT